MEYPRRILKGNWRHVFSDPELWFLLFANGVLGYLYFTGEISASTLLWIYYSQNILIGIQYFIRILNLKKFSTKNFTMNKRPVDPTPSVKRQVAFFFLLHYGLFHFVYFIFLIVNLTGESDALFNPTFFFLSVVGFAANMIVSLTSQVRTDREEMSNIGHILFTPYLRIVPMHLFILIGFMSSNFQILSVPVRPILIFLVLKTVSDALMHIIVNKTWRYHRERVVWGDVL